jgi:hypothetical protein
VKQGPCERLILHHWYAVFFRHVYHSMCQFSRPLADDLRRTHRLALIKDRNGDVLRVGDQDIRVLYAIESRASFEQFFSQFTDAGSHAGISISALYLVF